jgi:ribosomal protein S18 acetylase RimI-like enzyme
VVSPIAVTPALATYGSRPVRSEGSPRDVAISRRWDVSDGTLWHPERMNASPDVAAAIAEFRDQLAKGEATSVATVTGGHAVLNADYPASYQHNRLVLHEPVTFDLARAEADRVLGGAGLTHRRIDWVGEPPALLDQPEWQLDRSVFLHLPEQVALTESVGAPVDLVEVLPFEDLRESILDGWLPDMTAAVAEQLTDRSRATAKACDLTFHVVRVDDRTAAHCELRMLHLADGTKAAQVENVVTKPAHRGNGYAKAVTAHAATSARAAGAELVWLEADRDDWPRNLYSRMGFALTDLETTTASRSS